MIELDEFDIPRREHIKMFFLPLLIVSSWTFAYCVVIAVLHRKMMCPPSNRSRLSIKNRKHIAMKDAVWRWFVAIRFRA
jgi:hypothetical protein